MKPERGCGRCGRNASLQWYRCCTRHVFIRGAKEERVFCATCIELLHPGENLAQQAEENYAAERSHVDPE